MPTDKSKHNKAAETERAAQPGVLRRALQNRSIQLGGIIILLLVLVALLAPLLAPYEPTKLALGRRLASPSWAFPFGTDEFGRDILSRVIFGTRLTLYVGVVAVGIGLLSGVTS